MRLQISLVLAATLVTGCVTDEMDPTNDTDTETPDLSSTASAVSSNSVGWYSCASNQLHCEFPLKKRTDSYSCFFTGVGGTFKNALGNVPVGGWLTKVIVDDEWIGYHYEWRVDIDRRNFADAMSVEVSCIPNTGHQQLYTWNPTSGTATTIDTSGLPQRRCFISGVRAKGSNGFGVWDSTAHLFAQGSTLRLGGTMPANSNDDIQVTCMDVPSTAGTWSFWNGNGSDPDELVRSNPGGIACGLTGIGGVWRDNDSASIDYHANSAEWWAHVSANRGGEFACVQ